MPTDEETVALYNSKAGDYAEAFSDARSDPALERFMTALPNQAAVLDLGCGPGAHAAAMLARGFKVTATDASSAMVETARAHQGVDVRLAGFDDLRDQAVYAGVWANFSLLHAPRSAMPAHLARIAAALKPGGILHLGMKTGEGERRDHLGRFYTFYSVQELRHLLLGAGFELVEEVEGEGVGLAGTVDPWVVILARLRT